LTDVFSDQAIKDTNEGVSRREKFLRRVVAPLVIGATVIASKDMIEHAASGSSPHSVEYLNGYPQETGVIVQAGDSPDSIAQAVNAGGFSGQLRADELRYIANEGLSKDQQGNPILVPGQTVDVPVLPREDTK
jgi:hypothetical protein